MTPTPVPETGTHTILIVESLEDCGFRVVVAQDGEEGLRRYCV